MDYDNLFIAKFVILSLLFMIMIWKMGASSLGMAYRILFTLCAPVGVYFALAGKSVGKSHRAGGY